MKDSFLVVKNIPSVNLKDMLRSKTFHFVTLVSISVILIPIFIIFTVFKKTSILILFFSPPLSLILYKHQFKILYNGDPSHSSIHKSLKNEITLVVG